MGAYQSSTEDNRAHYPQGYSSNGDSTYKPYDQRFLTLVPSSEDSYQTYNIKMSTPAQDLSSGEHVYFLGQPRYLGLEYTTGLSHILLRDKSG
jgi:hypothetical protein